MKLFRILMASVALSGAPAAHAAVVGNLGGGIDPFSSLSNVGLDGGAVALLLGGTIYNSDQPFADIPAGGVFESKFLGAGPTSGNTATLTFTTAINYLSFLWGSPDTYNRLRITSTSGIYDFTAAGMGFSVTNGNQSFSQYVNFATNAPGEVITSATFSNSPLTDAFEVANFSIRSAPAVPEPATWAMMLVGFGLIGGAVRASRARASIALA